MIGSSAALLGAFATSWKMFMCALIIVGCGLSPFITITFVLLNEISGINSKKAKNLGRFQRLFFNYHGASAKLFLLQ